MTAVANAFEEFKAENDFSRYPGDMTKTYRAWLDDVDDDSAKYLNEVKELKSGSVDTFISNHEGRIEIAQVIHYRLYGEFETPHFANDIDIHAFGEPFGLKSGGPIFREIEGTILANPFPGLRSMDSTWSNRFFWPFNGN